MVKSLQSQRTDMAADLTERVRELAEARGMPASELLEQAIERGVEDRSRNLVRSRYVSDDIDRETAVDLVDRDCLKRADRESDAIEDDPR